MSSKREAMDISTMSTEQKAELAALLVADHEVAKLAREKGAKINKSATVPPSERKPSKSALNAEIVLEVNNLFGAKYDEAQKSVVTVNMSAMDKYQVLCAEKEVSPSAKAGFRPNGNKDNPGYTFKTSGGSGSTPQFDPVTYKVLSGVVGESDEQRAVLEAMATFDKGYSPTSAEIKVAMGVASNANIQKSLNTVAEENEKILRSQANGRLES